MGNKNTNKSNDFVVLQPDEKIKRNAYEIERQILSNSGLELDKEVYTEDVYFDFYGKNYLHTLRCGREEDKITRNIIIVHGYQGSSITFYKLFKHLYPKYNVYCPDIIGMGLSSRPIIKFTSTEETLEFFIESFEKWREALNLEKFHMVGHSLGGYIVSLYALKYPQYITKLTLLSPAGITDPKKGGNISERIPFGKKFGFFMLGTVWGMKLTMKNMYDNPVTRLTMKGPLRKRYELSKEENEQMAKLTEYSFQYPKDLDEAIYYIFKNPIPTVNYPLEDILYDRIKDFNVDIIFGELDWMDRDGSFRLCNRDNDRFKLYFVPKGGHNFNLENPDDLAPLLIKNKEIDEEETSDVSLEKRRSVIETSNCTNIMIELESKEMNTGNIENNDSNNIFS